MKCKDIMDLILTDYIDGELNATEEKNIEAHLKSCLRCREFLNEVMQSTAAPFTNAERLKAPESIWYGVKRIFAQEKPRGLLSGSMEGLRSILTFRRPVLATTTLAVIILIVIAVFMLPSGTMITSGNRNGVNAYLDDQILYFSYLGNGEEFYSEVDNIDLGTSIEEYLL